MRAEKNSKAKPQKKTGKRILTLVLALVVILIVMVFVLVPAFISSEKGRQFILAKINNSITGRTDFADLSMGWFKGIKIEDFGFNDNAGQISVQVKQIATKPHYGSILTGNLSFGQTTIDQPRVQINLKELTKAPQKEPSTPPKTGPVVLPIQRIDLELNEGSIKVTDSQARTVELSQINSGLNLRPPGQQTSFAVNMAVADQDKQSTLQAEGRLKPAKTGWTLKGTTGDLTVEVNDLDLESLGPFLALAGIDIRAAGHVQGAMKSEIIDGRLENLNANIKANNLDITGDVLKGDRPKTDNLDINVRLNQSEGKIKIDDMQIQSDWASASVSGVVPTSVKSFSDFLKADSGYDLKGVFDCDLPAIMSQLPNTIGLKEGTTVTSGRLNGNIETITQAGQKQIQAQATVSDLGGVVEGKKVALSAPIKAQTLISSNKAGINIDKLDVSSSFAMINCTGSIELINYNAQVDLSKLQSELGQFVNIGQYQMAGQLLGKGNVSIKDKIIASGSTQIDNLRVTSSDGQTVTEPKANLDFAVAIDQKENIVTINSASTDASFGRISLKDSVVPMSQKAAKPMNLLVNASNLDLAKILPFAVMFGSLPKEMKLAGIGESEIQISSENNIYHISTEKTRFKNFELSYPGEKPFKQSNVSIVADIRHDPIEKIPTGKLNLLSDQFKIHYASSINKKNDTKSELQGNAELEYDWSAVSTLAAPYLPEDLIIQGKRKGTVSFTSEYPAGEPNKIMDNLSAKAKVGFEKADYMGLNFEQTDLDIQGRDGLLNIAPFTTIVNEGQLNFAAQVDFKQSPALFKTPKPMQLLKDIRINDRTTKKLLMYLSPIFANAVNVSGIANFTCEQLAIPLSSAAKNQAVVVGTVSISQLHLQASDLLNQILKVARTSVRDATITIHPTRFVLQDGFLRYDNMQIDVDNYPVNFKGVIGLDKSMNMMVTLPYTIDGRTVTLGDKDLDRRITLPLKGTVDKPELDMGKLLEQELQRQTEDLLRKGLEELFK